VKNSGDTQARFLEKSLVFFSNQQSAISIQPTKVYRKGREEAQRERG
jgi:hypothetical protein